MKAFALEYHTKICILHNNKMHFQILNVSYTWVLMVIAHTRCMMLQSLASQRKTNNKTPQNTNLLKYLAFIQFEF